MFGAGRCSAWPAGIKKLPCFKHHPGGALLPPSPPPPPHLRRLSFGKYSLGFRLRKGGGGMSQSVNHRCLFWLTGGEAAPLTNLRKSPRFATPSFPAAANLERVLCLRVLGCSREMSRVNDCLCTVDFLISASRLVGERLCLDWKEPSGRSAAPPKATFPFPDVLLL